MLDRASCVSQCPSDSNSSYLQTLFVRMALVGLIVAVPAKQAFAAQIKSTGNDVDILHPTLVDKADETEELTKSNILKRIEDFKILLLSITRIRVIYNKIISDSDLTPDDHSTILESADATKTKEVSTMLEQNKTLEALKIVIQIQRDDLTDYIALLLRLQLNFGILNGLQSDPQLTDWLKALPEMLKDCQEMNTLLTEMLK